MEIQAFELRLMLMDATEMGATKALVEAGVLKPFLSKSEAYKKYGRSTVDRWISEGLVKPIKDGTETSKMRISRIEIEATAKAANRASWYNHYK